MVCWCPDSAKAKNKMIQSTVQFAFTKELIGIKASTSADDECLLDADYLKQRAGDK